MDLITVISFLLVGIVLIVVEIIFIPGTTIVGIIGFCVTVAGIVMSFNIYGKPVGWMVLGITGLISGSLLYWSLRSNVWGRFSLKNTIDSKVNEGQVASLTEGEAGVAISSLRPMGKADFAGKQYEVSSLGHFVESGTKIKIVKISSHHIIVEPLS